jgi:hypothetical protein
MLQAGRSLVRDQMRQLIFSGRTQPLTEMNIRSREMFLVSRALPVRRAYCHLLADFLDNMGSLKSHNSIGHHGLLRDSFTLLLL